ncbi:MAG: SOS response-associated peptidase [Acetobacteraceae bacterium]|nr:SOS response-associated peptidase [Acetobacteraceae bacterium]
MCGRFFLQRDPAGLARYFGTANPLPNLRPSWNVAPTQESPVVRRHPETGARHLDLLRWGLVPRWAKDASGGARMMNARAESVADKPAFRDAFRRRRCLVPMDGFYEWRQEGARKQPYAVAMADGSPMAAAGLWEGWRQPDGTWLRTFAIITTGANAKLAPVHERMPALLAREEFDAWLDPASPPEALRALLRPCPPAWLACWPVSPRVGRIAENDAGLIARDPDARPPPGLDDGPVFGG